MVIPSIIILLAFQPICRLFKRWQYVVAFLTIQIHIDLKNALKYVQASAPELTHANVTVKMSWQAFISISYLKSGRFLAQISPRMTYSCLILLHWFF